MNSLKVLGTKELNGKDVKIIEGGFGNGQKVMLSSDIAKQHKVETREINQLIDRNISRFNKDDLIDLCTKDFKITASDLGLISSNNQKHCYLLSQRGYTKLVSMMSNNNDKKWEVMDQLINEYFSMRETINAGVPVLDVNQMINDMMPTLIQNTIQSTMLAMSTVLEKNNQLIMSRIESAERGYIDAKNIITEQEIRHSKELEETKELIGLKTKNTSSLTKLLKAKLSSIKGYQVKADDYHYVIFRERLFRTLDVWTWESIPVSRYNEIHALIDSVDSLDDIFTM